MVFYHLICVDTRNLSPHTGAFFYSQSVQFGNSGAEIFSAQGHSEAFFCTRAEILFFCSRTEKIDSFVCLRFIARKEAGDEKNSIPTSNPHKLVHIHFSVSTNVLFWSLMPSLKPSLRSGFKAKAFVPRKIYQSRLKNGCTRFRGFSVGKILFLGKKVASFLVEISCRTPPFVLKVSSFNVTSKVKRRSTFACLQLHVNSMHVNSLRTYIQILL